MEWNSCIGKTILRNIKTHYKAWMSFSSTSAIMKKVCTHETSCVPKPSHPHRKNFRWRKKWKKPQKERRRRDPSSRIDRRKRCDNTFNSHDRNDSNIVSSKPIRKGMSGKRTTLGTDSVRNMLATARGADLPKVACCIIKINLQVTSIYSWHRTPNGTTVLWKGFCKELWLILSLNPHNLQ